MEIGAALLAGGNSRRMGRNKALLLMDGIPFQTRIAAQLSDFPERLFSVGTAGGTPPAGFTAVADRLPGCGPLGGLHALLSGCSSEALVVVSCDVPLFSGALGHFLADCLSRRGGDAVIPVTRDGREHPVCGVYRKSCLPRLEEQLAGGDYRMRTLLGRLRTERVGLEGTPFSDACLCNVNTPEEYRALLRAAKTPRGPS